MLEFLLSFVNSYVNPPSPPQPRQMRLVNTPGGFYNSKTPTSKDFFGTAVAISGDGNVAVCGGSPSGPAGVGRVSVYAFIESAWTYCQDLIIPDGVVGTCYGNSLAVSYDGSYIFVGAPKTPLGPITGVGAVHTFKKQAGSSYVWNHAHSNFSNVEQPESYFGHSISCSSDGGKYVSSNYTRTNANSTLQPSVEVYTVWNGTHNIDSSVNLGSLGLSEDYGAVVSLDASGTSLIVSAPCADNLKGACYFYKTEGQGWSAPIKLSAHIEDFENNLFGSGSAISPDGNVIAITNVVNKLYIFRKINGIFEPESCLETGSSSVQAQGVHCVSPVSLSWDGNIVIVGDPGDNSDSIESYGGAVYLFEKTNDGWFKSIKNTTWTQEYNDRLGSSVSICYDYGFSGSRHYLVGAPSKETQGYFEVFHSDI